MDERPTPSERGDSKRSNSSRWAVVGLLGTFAARVVVLAFAQALSKRIDGDESALDRQTTTTELTSATDRTTTVTSRITLTSPATVTVSTSAETSATPPPSTAQWPPARSPVGYLDLVDLEDLPYEALDVINAIEADGPFEYDRDGIVFQNRERILPSRQRGYYHEYTVRTPGESDRGARRLITGDDGSLFYTRDHYQSFVQVDVQLDLP
jgi:ribonuclease T1